MSTNIVPRQSLEDVVAGRDRTIALYEQAFDKIEAAADAAAKAAEAWALAVPSKKGAYVDDPEKLSRINNATSFRKREDIMPLVRHMVDVTAWQHIIGMCNIESIMDTKERKRLRQQMQNVSGHPGVNEAECMPPLTLENIEATISGLLGQADELWLRGLANVFSGLDRRFRSHDGFKFGNRIIIDRLFDDSGWWLYQSSHEQKIIDVERVLMILDGKDPTSVAYSGIIPVLREERGNRSGARQSEHEGDYFRIKIFKNGNAHLWFTRKDLVERANKELARYYGEVIGDGNTAEEDVFKNVKTTPARRYGFFPTPPAAVEIVDQYLGLGRREPDHPILVLEPSAGTGNLARLAATTNYRVRAPGSYASVTPPVIIDCCEIQQNMADALRHEPWTRTVWGQDFLSLDPDHCDQYDLVLMNPPFDRERDIDHVMHAAKFLKPSGKLVAIMSAGTEFRETRKANAFRDFIESKHGGFFDLPAGSFKESGTNVNTVVVVFWNDGTQISRWSY